MISALEFITGVYGAVFSFTLLGLACCKLQEDLRVFCFNKKSARNVTHDLGLIGGAACALLCCFGLVADVLVRFAN